MKLEKIIAWMGGVLKPEKFDDVSNNGLQIARSGADIKKVAFAVDGSLRSVKAAAEAGAQLLVVHHGISWGGGIKRIEGGAYGIVKTAMDADLALYASHLPLDANKLCGNNWELARALGLKNVKSAFSYHGNVIGVVGMFSGNASALAKRLEKMFGSGAASSVTHFIKSVTSGGPDSFGQSINRLIDKSKNSLTLGICSGGAGCFAPDAKALGCDLFLTGEADWGEVIAAENVGMPMICAGHYETETFGVKALMREMKKALKIATTFVALALCLNVFAEGAGGRLEVGGGTKAESNSSVQPSTYNLQPEEYGFDRWYVGLSGQLVLPQGGSKMRRLGGAAAQFGWCWSESLAFEGEAAWLEDRCGLAARARIHFNMLETYDKLFGYSRFDPFVTLGAQGWINNGQVGPAAGLGALYYLTDHWALRGDATATLGLETDVEMIYALGLGVQYSF